MSFVWFWITLGWQLTREAFWQGEFRSFSAVLSLGQVSTKNEFFGLAELSGRVKGLWFRRNSPISAQQMCYEVLMKYVGVLLF